MSGDQQRSNVFAEAWVRQMGVLEAIAWANDLRDLQEHPGWVKVQEVLTAQVDHARKGAAVNPAMAARAIAADPLKAAVNYADAAGQIKGFGSLATMVSTVIAVTDELQAVIEAEGE